MLANIHDVPWSELTHAYGPATDVPAQIRDLCSDDKEVRDKARWELYGNIFHQGTRYQATPYAVPFLYELLEASATPDRHEIVYLLVNLALGYEEYFLPAGFDPATARTEARRAHERMSPEERAECEEFGFGPLLDVECYDAVRTGVPKLIALAEDDDRQVARAAVYALAWFPEDADESLPAVRRHLDSLDETTLANALLASGLLARRSGAHDDAERRQYLTHDSRLVRTAAAISVAEEPLAEDVLEILLEALRSAEDLRWESLRFNDGDLAGYASRVLAAAGREERERIVPILCRLLETVNPHQSLDVTAALLELVSGDQSLGDTPAEDLEPLQIEALTAIAEHGGWTINGGVFVNYGSTVRLYGLPSVQNKLREYLGLANEPDDRSVSMNRANVLALLYGGLPALFFVVLHYVLRGDIDWLGAFHSLPIFLGVTAVGILIHEGLHALAYRMKGVATRDIRFGFDKKTFTPYVHCNVAIEAGKYRFSLLLPGLATGVLPALAGIALDLSILTAWGAFFVLAAGGDFLVFWLIRDLGAERRVRDHPSRVGCLLE